MKKNIDIKKPLAKLNNLFLAVKKYAGIVFIIAVAFIYGFIVWQIRSLANKEPSEDAINEQVLEVKRPKIDQKAVDKIKQLQDTNVQVQALFKQARDNPFQD